MFSWWSHPLMGKALASGVIPIGYLFQLQKTAAHSDGTKHIPLHNPLSACHIPHNTMCYIRGTTRDTRLLHYLTILSVHNAWGCLWMYNRWKHLSCTMYCVLTKFLDRTVAVFNALNYMHSTPEFVIMRSPSRNSSDISAGLHTKLTRTRSRGHTIQCANCPDWTA